MDSGFLNDAFTLEECPREEKGISTGNVGAVVTCMSLQISHQIFRRIEISDPNTSYHNLKNRPSLAVASSPIQLFELPIA